MPKNLQFVEDTPDSVKLCRKTYNGSLECLEYLFQRDYESDRSFEGRQKFVSVGANYKKNIDSVLTMIFKSPVRYDGIDAQLEDLYTKVDGTSSITFFSKETLKSVLLEHTGYVLVWTPENIAQNKAEEKELGIRPYAENIHRSRIINKYTQRNEAGELTQICIAGSYEMQDPDDEYLLVDKIEYRFYFADGTVHVFREANGGFELFDIIYSELKKMPIVEFIYDTNPKQTPPFYDPALHQLHIMNIESGKDRYNFDLPFATVVTYGMLQNQKNLVITDPTTGVSKVEFRSDKGIDFPVNPETGARLGGVEFVERDGKIDDILGGTIEDKKTSINEAFVKLISDSLTGNKTTEQSESERAMGLGALSSLSAGMKDGLNKVHALFSESMGSTTPQGELYLDLDFISKELTRDNLELFNGLYMEGVLSDTEYIKCLQDPEYFESLDADELAVRKRDQGL